jgi:quercetin dioxygenase-like cupin family protein
MTAGRAQMAELVDALVSGTSGRKAVGVRVPFWAPGVSLMLTAKKANVNTTNVNVAAALLTVGCLLGAGAPLSASAQPNPYPGFSCVTLAHRQALAGAPGTTFRVEKLIFAPNSLPSEHKHRGGEIVYLLSGSGTNTMNGSTTALTKDRALVIPAGVHHSLLPTNGSTLTVIAVQFSDKARPAFEAVKPKGPAVCRD